MTYCNQCGYSLPLCHCQKYEQQQERMQPPPLNPMYYPIESNDETHRLLKDILEELKTMSDHLKDIRRKI